MVYHHFFISVQFNATDENIDNMKHSESIVTVTDDWRFYAESSIADDGEQFFQAMFEAYAPSFEPVPGSTLLKVYLLDEKLFSFMVDKFPCIRWTNEPMLIEFDLEQWEFSIRNSDYQLVVRNSDEL